MDIAQEQVRAKERRRLALEVPIPLALLAWRVLAVPVGVVWRDWLAILSLYWIAALLTAKSKAWPWITGVVSAGLLAIYFYGQLPLVFAVFGISRE
jgi:hypothetical protein